MLYSFESPFRIAPELQGSGVDVFTASVSSHRDKLIVPFCPRTEQVLRS